MKLIPIAFLVLLSITAYANGTANEKAETAADTATHKAKQTVRKAKKKLRKKTGHQDRAKDVKDSFRNAGEDVSDKAKEAKRKVN